jgi:hypothetical protein
MLFVSGGVGLWMNDLGRLMRIFASVSERKESEKTTSYYVLSVGLVVACVGYWAHT